MCKASGIILIILSIGMFTYIKVESRRKELFNLEEMSKALTFIKHELCFSQPELASLCSKAAEHTKGDISVVFNDVSVALRKDKTLDFYSAWVAATGNICFSKDAENVVLHFARDLGKKTLETEIENIENTIKEINALIVEKKDKYKSDKKLICSLSAAVGAVIVILAV